MTSTSKDVNSKQNHSILGKRKKVREKRGNYLQKWIEKTTHQTLDAIPDSEVNDNFVNPMNGNYWNTHHNPYGQRLFNAASDPSVFRYSTPYGYPHEPMSLPIYPPPIYPLAIPPLLPNFLALSQQTPSKYTQTPQRKNTRHSKRNITRKQTCNSIENEFCVLQNGHSAISKAKPSNSLSSATGIQNDYASLPPAINHITDSLNNTCQEDDSSGNHRRFSDPGLAQNQGFENSHEDSQDESDSGSSVHGGSQTDNRLLMCLVDQINSLKESNRKLFKELHETKAELEAVKQQTAIWRSDSVANMTPSPQSVGTPLGSQAAGLANSSTMYSPGMLADLVREIRDAARVREEALYTKVRHLLDERNSNMKMNGNTGVEKGLPEWLQYEQLKNQLHMNGIEKSRTNDRLGKLEEELHNLRIHQSREDMPPSLGSALGALGLSPATVNGPSMVVEHERHRLRAELNEERAARLAADARAHKLELLVTQLRSKRGGNNPPSSHNGSISSPPDAPHMVLGPVTDL